MSFARFETLVDNPQPEKRVASVRVGVRLYNAEGQLSITDMLFQEGDKETGYAPCLSEMLTATNRRRRVNAVIHGDATLVLLNEGSAACGCTATIRPTTAAERLSLSQGYGAQRLEVGSAGIDDTVIIDSLSVSARLNGSEAPHSGFFPYVQDGMSRHTVQLDGAATILFDYSERDGGVGS
jgi:hypothetical protein